MIIIWNMMTVSFIDLASFKVCNSYGKIISQKD